MKKHAPHLLIALGLSVAGLSPALSARDAAPQQENAEPANPPPREAKEGEAKPEKPKITLKKVDFDPRRQRRIPGVAPDPSKAFKQKLDPTAAPPETIDPPPDYAAIPENALRMDSGLSYRVVQDGWGETKPSGNDVIAVHYAGWLADGRLFDTSANRRDPKEVQVNRSGGGLADLFTDMVAGERRVVWVPEEMADKYRDPKLSGHVVFDVSLIDIDAAPPTPPSLEYPPEEAVTSTTGLSHVVLADGRGTEQPNEYDLVLLHVDAWDLDGRMRASTRRGVPAPRSFHMERMIPGFREAVLDMKVGEKRRVWVPRHLSLTGQDGEGGSPQTAEIELVSFIRNPNHADGFQAPEEGLSRTDSGMAYRVVRPGDGELRPGDGMTVVMHYTVWASDGRVVDSSFRQQKPVSMPMNDSLPPGVRETLGLMAKGEKRVVWIPPELGFAPSDKIPPGLLMFEIDIVEIH